MYFHYKIKKLFLRSECGRSSISTARVTGGNEARHGDFPWQVLLLEYGQSICGGSIISPKWIKTASHCIVDGSGREKNSWTINVR